MPGALDGVRIVDFSRHTAGAYAAMLLAEQGADVLKMAPASGDARTQPAGFRVWDRSKRAAGAILSTSAGRDRLAALVSTAGVVVVDCPPAEAARLGLTYAELGRDNPRLIYLDMPPFGSRGPLADRPAGDGLVAAHGGIMGSQWSMVVRPTYITMPFASYGAALLGAGAVAAALHARARDGHGQRVEVSWLAGALAMQTGSLLLGEGVERFAGSGMNPLGPVPVYRLYRAADDRYLFIACGNPRFFQRLCLLLDHPEWISDPRFEAAPWGVVDPDDRRALAELIAPIIAARPRDEWLRLLTDADIPNAPVLERRAFIDDPGVRHLGLRVEVNDPMLGPTVQMGVPLVLHGAPGAVKGPAPAPEDFASPDPRWETEIGAGTTPAVPPASERETTPRPHSPQHPSPDTQHPAPLAGIRVLDLSSYIAGSYCPMTLADYGADVIKVESLDGDAFRTFGFGFLGWNRGKRSLAVDLKSEAGRAAVHALVRTADVVVENFRPGVAARLGVNYATLSAINPRLIYSTATAFGSDGPLADLPGFDPLLQARSGAMAAQGGVPDGHPPVYLTVAVCDYTAALLSVFGICAALFNRDRTGRGERVETSLVHSAMAGQSGEFIHGPRVPPPAAGGPDLDGVAPLHRLFECADGWLFIAATTTAHAAAIAGVAGVAMLPAPDAPAPPSDGEPAGALTRVFRERIVADWEAELLAAGVPAGRVLAAPDLFSDAQIAANELLAEHRHPTWGRIRQTGVLVKFDRTPGVAERAAPLLGEHSVEVLAEAGYDGERIAALVAAGVVGTA